MTLGMIAGLRVWRAVEVAGWVRVEVEFDLGFEPAEPQPLTQIPRATMAPRTEGDLGLIVATTRHPRRLGPSGA